MSKKFDEILFNCTTNKFREDKDFRQVWFTRAEVMLALRLVVSECASLNTTTTEKLLIHFGLANKDCK